MAPHIVPGAIPFSGSTILSEPQKQKLLEWISNKSATLIYKATRDGFKASNFHKKCDNMGKTLTVIRSIEGHLFGGYTEHNWDSTTNDYKFGSTWIFTLSNPTNDGPLQFLLRNNANTMHGIYCSGGHGPLFGNGWDIGVYDNSNNTTNSYCNFPGSFQDTTGRGNNTFTGARRFQTNEIEVFLIQ